MSPAMSPELSTAPAAPVGFRPGLEGHIAFRTRIAEPDRDGGALRYRGVDIEELAGRVTFGNVWALLVDGRFGPGPAARRAVPDPGAQRRRAGRRPGRAGDARAVLGLPAAARHHRRRGAGEPGAGVGDGAVVRRAVGARHRACPRCRSGGIDECTTITERFMTRWRGEPDPAHVRARRRVLGVGRRARAQRLDVHRARDRLDRRGRRRGALRGDRGDVRSAARRGAGPGAADDRRGRAHGRRRRAWSPGSWTAASG